MLFPSKPIAFTESLTFALPCATRPIKHLPKYGSESNKVASIANGLSCSTCGCCT